VARFPSAPTSLISLLSCVARAVPLGYTDSGHACSPRALARAWSIIATTSFLAIAFSATSVRRYVTSCSLAATSASYISGAAANNGPHSSGASGAKPATPLFGSTPLTISFPFHSHGPGVLITLTLLVSSSLFRYCEGRADEV